MADNENRGPQLQAVGYTLVVIAFVTAVLRFYTRVFIVKNFGFDDWSMAAALVFFILFVVCALIGVEHGTGRHQWTLADEDRQKAMRYWWYCYMWYFLSMIFSKISIGWFLLRITIRRRDIWTIYGVMAITVLTGLVFFFVTLFQCSPMSYFWDQGQPGSCINIDVIVNLTYMYSACSVVCDFTFAILPVVLIWSLHMEKKNKLALIPIVLMACVASAAVVVRFKYVHNFKNPDFLFATIDIAIWSTTEQGLAIIAGSLATLRPLFRAVSSRLVTRASQTTSGLEANVPQSDRTRDGQRSNGKARSMIRLTEFETDGDDVSEEANTRSIRSVEDWTQRRT